MAFKCRTLKVNNLEWLLVSAFPSGHHQTMHNFELKENHTEASSFFILRRFFCFSLIKNDEWSDDGQNGRPKLVIIEDY
jgi:hypothetical protein